MAIFKNPNEPEQPQKGVYVWYATKGDIELPLYVGQAGKKTSMFLKGTLFRGVSELQQCTFSSNSPNYDTLDTDFIVGATIKFFERAGYKCIWKHVSNNPNEEIQYAERLKPFLQVNGKARIKDHFRIKNKNRYWKLSKVPTELEKNKVKEAEEAIYHKIEIALCK